MVSAAIHRPVHRWRIQAPMPWPIEASLYAAQAQHGGQENLMNTCIAGPQDDTAEGGALLDALPLPTDACASGWMRREHVLGASFANALDMAAQRHSVGLEVMLGAA